MRLYKPKEIPKHHLNRIISPPAPPSSAPDSPTSHRLKRAAEAVSKQISGHKAMVAQFKQIRLPRPPMFTTKSATLPQTERSISTKHSKATKGSGILPNVSAKPPMPNAPISSAKPGRRAAAPSGSNTKSRSPPKPPGLHSVKKPSTLLSAPVKSKSIPPPINSPPQTAGASPAAAPQATNLLASTGTHLTNTSASSVSDDVDIDGPILFISCFHSSEEDPEEDYDSFEPVELTSVGSRFDVQVAQIFGTGLGPASDKELLRHGDMAPPTITPQATFTSTLEAMSAVVELWEQADNTAAQCESKERSDVSATIPPQQTVVCVPKDLSRQLPSSVDYEYVASLGRDAFRALSLGVHKQSLRKCCIKTVSNAIVKEEDIVHAILEEQRIMREVSGYPFLLGLMASFHDANGFYLVSVGFVSSRSARKRRKCDGSDRRSIVV
jgi:hypothetical protein